MNRPQISLQLKQYLGVVASVKLSRNTGFFRPMLMVADWKLKVVNPHDKLVVLWNKILKRFLAILLQYRKPDNQRSYVANHVAALSLRQFAIKFADTIQFIVL